jgi:hypothetical protein
MSAVSTESDKSFRRPVLVAPNLDKQHSELQWLRKRVRLAEAHSKLQSVPSVLTQPSGFADFSKWHGGKTT